MRIRIRIRFWWNKWIASRQLKFARRFDKKKKMKKTLAIRQKKLKFWKHRSMVSSFKIQVVIQCPLKSSLNSG